MHKRMDGQTKTDRQMAGKMDECTGWIDEWMHRRMDGKTDGEKTDTQRER